MTNTAVNVSERVKSRQFSFVPKQMFLQRGVKIKGLENARPRIYN